MQEVSVVNERNVVYGKVKINPRMNHELIGYCFKRCLHKHFKDVSFSYLEEGKTQTIEKVVLKSYTPPKTRFILYKNEEDVFDQTKKLTHYRGNRWKSIIIVLESPKQVRCVDKYASSLEELSVCSVNLNYDCFKSISNLRNLSSLSLINCFKLHEPDTNLKFLSNLKTLKYVDLKGNNIRYLERIPFQAWTLLEVIILDSNNLEQLHEDIWKMKHLKTLSVKRNPYLSRFCFPDKVVSQLEELKMLETRLHLPPKEILVNLKVLSMGENVTDGNRIEETSKEKLPNLRKLTYRNSSAKTFCFYGVLEAKRLTKLKLTHFLLPTEDILRHVEHTFSLKRLYIDHNFRLGININLKDFCFQIEQRNKTYEAILKKMLVCFILCCRHHLLSKDIGTYIARIIFKERNDVFEKWLSCETNSTKVTYLI